MDKILLKDPDIYPTDEVIEENLGNVYPVYNELLTDITGDNFSLTPEWRYYNDGKAWLCKVVKKKKTIMWISVWNNHIKVSFYFAERYVPGIAGLPISDDIKERVLKEKTVGRIVPLILSIDKKEQLTDLLTIADYKLKLK